MCKYKIRVYDAGVYYEGYSHYVDYFYNSTESLALFAERLAKNGFSTDDGNKWIMPASILSVEVDK